MMTEREGRWVSRKGGKSLKRKHWGISRYVGYIENKGEREREREAKMFERGKKIRRDSGRHRIEENSTSREWEKETTTGEIKRDGWKARHRGETKSGGTKRAED